MQRTSFPIVNCGFFITHPLLLSNRHMIQILVNRLVFLYQKLKIIAARGLADLKNDELVN